MVLDAREQHPHGVGAVVQVGDPGAVQVAGQLVDVRLQLCKSCSGGQNRAGRAELREPLGGGFGQGWLPALPVGQLRKGFRGAQTPLETPSQQLRVGEQALLRAETENKAVANLYAVHTWAHTPKTPPKAAQTNKDLFS